MLEDDFVLKSLLRYRMADINCNHITELMKKSGVGQNTIHKLYRGKDINTIKLATLIKLCNTFHCKLSDLVEYIPGEE